MILIAGEASQIFWLLNILLWILTRCRSSQHYTMTPIDLKAKTLDLSMPCPRYLSHFSPQRLTWSLKRLCYENTARQQHDRKSIHGETMAQNYETLGRFERRGFQEPNLTDTLNKYTKSSSPESIKKGHILLAKFGTLAYPGLLNPDWFKIRLKKNGL